MEEKQLRIKLFEVSENIEVVLEVTNRTTGEELKKMFRKKNKKTRNNNEVVEKNINNNDNNVNTLNQETEAN